MHSAHRSWLLLATVALSGVSIAACSADAGNGNGAGGDDSGTQDEGGSSTDSGSHDSSMHDATTDSSMPDSMTSDASSSDTSSDTSTDTATTDANDGGSSDAMVEADVPLPPVGSPCSPQGSMQTEGCGICGTQSRTCQGVDGGAPVWQAWSSCANQVANGCTPGRMMNEACGYCGMRQKECQTDCTWAVSACTGQPMNPCMPGTIDFETTPACDGGGQERTCNTSCGWGNFGGCIYFDGGGPLAVTIPFTVGAPATTKIVTLHTPVLDKLSTSSVNGNCAVDTTTSGVYDYVQIYNPTNLTATVSLWLSPGMSGVFDSIAATYTGATNPPATRTTCARYNDDCSTAPCFGSLMSGFINDISDNRIVLPPNGSVVLYIGTYATSSTAHDVQVNARTDVLQ